MGQVAFTITEEICKMFKQIGLNINFLNYSTLQCRTIPTFAPLK